MYCPRCGSQNTETTKYCRQCGLPLNQIVGYVSSGGTAPLAPARPTASNPIGKLTEGMSPRQKMVLLILLFVFAPGIFAAAGFDFLAPAAGVLMVLGIVWAVFRYKAEMRQLKQEPQPPQPLPPAPTPQMFAPPPTNPIGNQVHGSIVEDETQRLPGKK